MSGGRPKIRPISGRSYDFVVVAFSSVGVLALRLSGRLHRIGSVAVH